MELDIENHQLQTSPLISIIYCEKSEQEDWLKILEVLKNLHVLPEDMLNMNNNVQNLLPIIDNELIEEYGEIPKKYFECNLKRLIESQAMAQKYNMGVSDYGQLLYYHDPCTGILKFKENFEKDLKIEQLRSKELSKQITFQKISDIRIDLPPSDLGTNFDTGLHMKHFMKLWNTISIEYESRDKSSSEEFKHKNDSQTVKDMLDQMVTYYCNDINKVLKDLTMQKKQENM